MPGMSIITNPPGREALELFEEGQNGGKRDLSLTLSGKMAGFRWSGQGWGMLDPTRLIPAAGKPLEQVQHWEGVRF